MAARRAIIIGASSGIGHSLAIELANRNWKVAVAARREDRLIELCEAHKSIDAYHVIDVRSVDDARKLEAILTGFDSVDAVVISAGVGDVNKSLERDLELSTIATNVTGFTVMAATAARYFEGSNLSLGSKDGVLVGISSIAGCAGSGDATSYAATKAYQSNYLQGLRLRWMKRKLPLQALDVRPGFVDTAMAKGDGNGGGLFWVSKPEIAARQIANGIENKRAVIYVTKRWRIVSWLLALLPERVLARLG